MYLYFPPIPKHSPYKRCSVTVLLDEVDETAVERILEESGLKEMARERQLILAFPVPGPEGWEYDSDLSVIEQMQGAMTMEREFEPVQTYFGIPTLESMLASWHLMNDTRYLIGIGEKGAAMALTMAACQPANVAAVMAIGLALAAVLTRNKWVNKLFRSIYFLPIICSATAVGIMWQLILNSNIGYVSWMLRSIGLPKISFLKDPEIAMYTVIFMSVWRSFGISTIIFVAGMQEVPAELYESADLDGASKFREFFSITLPGIIPTIYFVLITRLIGSMQVFDLIFVTTGGGPNFRTETMVNYIYSRAFSSDTRLGYATAMSECLFAIILIISILFYRRMLKDEQA